MASDGLVMVRAGRRVGRHEGGRRLIIHCL
jgi:hypothetical protein